MRRFSLMLALTLGLASTATAQTIDRIRETGELKLGFQTDAAPISFANEEGNASGYSPLLCVGVAQVLSARLEIEDLKVDFVPVTAEDRFDKVASGEVDLLCGATTITQSRLEQVDFSIPTYVDGAVIMLQRNGSPNLRALAGKKIGVRAGTTTAEALENSLKQAGVEAEQVAFDSHDAGVDALANKEIEAYFGDQSILVYQLATKKLGNQLRLTNDLLSVEKQGLAMAKGDREFRLMVDAILSQMFRNGAISRVYQQTLPGIQPGAAMRALYTISPTLP